MASARGAVGARRAQAALVVSWVVVAVGVFAVYLAVVVGGGLLLGRTGTSRSALALLATVVVAVGLEPAQRRAHGAVARRLASPVTEPYQLLSGFAERLGGTASVEEMTGRMARVLAEGTAAAWAQVWLLVRGEVRLVASWPPAAVPDPLPPPLEDGHEGGVHSALVVHGDDVLGALRVRERDGRPMTAVEARLFAGLAGQAGLLLARAQLRNELQARVDALSAQARQLHAARAELVTASDVERRRLERNLHDGAQQELVALGINLKLARTLLASNPVRAGQVLAEQADAAEAAIATLMTLSRGLGPADLATDGLPAALRRLAAAAPLPTTVTIDVGSRYPGEVEAAAYYCASEALQNAVKHSGGSCVVITVSGNSSALVLRVADDGSGVLPGSSPAGTGTGTGLRGMRDRAAAQGGTVEVDGRPGSGTTVTVRLPARAVGENGP